METDGFTADAYHAAASKAVRMGAEGTPWHLALVQTERDSRQLPPQQNPYLVAKAAFLSNQIPTQFVACETFAMAPIVALPGQADKIIQIEPSVDPALEWRRFAGGSYDVRPLRAYEFSNVMLLDGALYCGASEQRIRPNEAHAGAVGDAGVLDIGEGVMAGSYYGLLFFGHWL